MQAKCDRDRQKCTAIYEGKQFYLVKNGQVGWISAYVDQNVGKK
jgi:hypothetical protein